MNVVLAKDLVALNGLVAVRMPEQMVLFKVTHKKLFVVTREALEERRRICSQLTADGLRLLRKEPRRDRPDYTRMQILFNCGIVTDQLGRPVFNPSSLSEEQRGALWKFECALAEACNEPSAARSAAAAKAAHDLAEVLGPASELGASSAEKESRARKRKAAAPAPTDRILRSAKRAT